MTSQRRKAANRSNARHSTGPKSPNGKRAVRLNGLRHGLLARDVVLPGEDEIAFEDLRSAIHADLVPSGPLETFLTDRIVNAVWRLGRLERAETKLLHWRAHVLKVEHLSARVRSFVETTPLLDLLPFGEQRTVITDEASHGRATKELDRAEYERDRDEVLLGRALNADATDSDTIGKLARYETTLERSLYKALHELQRLQAARQGKPVPVPAAVDVDVSVSASE